MKAGWKSCVVVTVGLVIAGSGCASTRASAKGGASPADDEIRRVLDAQVVAWNRGDLEGFMNGYWRSPDLMFVSDGRETRGWEPMLKHFHESYPTKESMEKLTFSNLEISVLGADNAQVLGRWKLEGKTPDGGTFKLTFRRIDGKWVIVEDRTSRDVP